MKLENIISYAAIRPIDSRTMPWKWRQKHGQANGVGSITSRGMPAFPEFTDGQLEGRQHYIRQVTHTTAEDYDEVMKTIK